MVPQLTVQTIFVTHQSPSIPRQVSFSADNVARLSEPTALSVLKAASRQRYRLGEPSDNVRLKKWFVLPLISESYCEPLIPVRMGRMNKRLTRISKYMSFILCHEPKSIGLKLNADGWTSIDEFVEKANASGKSVTAEQVMTVVAENDKQRFELSEDKSKIRAVQVSRKAVREKTRQAAAKRATPKSEEPVKKTIFTRSKIVQRSESSD